MAIDYYNAGMNAYEQGRYEEAFSWYAQNESDPRCLFSLAVLYYNGQGVEKNFAKSTHYYALAADAGVPQAMSSAGFAYANALGVPEDFDKAIHYLKMAVAKDQPAAKITLAELYARGLGEGTRKEAAQLIREVLQYGSDEEAMDVYNRYELHLA